MTARTTLFLSIRKVLITQDGTRRIIAPADAAWDDFFEVAGIALGERQQPEAQQRHGL